MMTPQEAIMIIRTVEYHLLFDEKWKDAFDMAISAIEALKAQQSEPCTDAISRQAAIDAINDLPDCLNGFSDTYDKSCIIGVLEELSPAQPERKTGTWIKEPNCYYRCSECGDHYPSIRGYMTYNFCPNCGAFMKGDSK